LSVPPSPKGELLVIAIVVTESTGIRPVVPRVIDDHVEDDTDGEGFTVLFIGMGLVNQIYKILLGAKARVDIQIIVDVVPMVRPIIVAENRGEPDGGATEPSNIIEILGNALDFATVEVVRSLCSLAPTWREGRVAVCVVMEPVHHKEIDKFFPPFTVKIEVLLSRSRCKIDLL
jgi:hypothetical protein